jgi:hypothetical protein
MPLANITWLDGGLVGGPVDPGYGQGSPVYRPDQSLPKPPGSIGTLPVFPFDPTIDNSLPTAPVTPSNPIQLHPGLKLVVKWVACLGFIAVPDNELPEHAQPK